MLACMSDDALALHGRERSLDLLWLSNDVCISTLPPPLLVRQASMKSITKSRTPVFMGVARGVSTRDRRHFEGLQQSFRWPCTFLAQGAAASAPTSTAGELQLSGPLPMQRAVGCRATAAAAAANVPSLQAAGNAVLAGNRMQRLDALSGRPRPQADPGWKVRRLAMIKRHARRRSLGSEQELEDDLAG